MSKRTLKIAAVAGALALTGILSSPCAFADRLADIKTRGKLVCGTQNASAPYAYQDPATRTFVGYDVDICKALAKGLGVALEHKPLSTEARIPELKMDRVDVVAGSMAYLPERAQQVDFSLQYLQGGIKVLVKKDSGIRTLTDLGNKKVCASKGSSSAAVATRVLGKSQILTFQDISSCYLALQNDKVEAFTAGELVLKRFELDSVKAGEPLRMLAQPTYVEHIGLVVNKGNPELLAALNNVLRNIDKSGELDRTYDKWLGKDSIYGLTRQFRVEPVDSQ